MPLDEHPNLSRGAFRIFTAAAIIIMIMISSTMQSAAANPHRSISDSFDLAVLGGGYFRDHRLVENKLTNAIEHMNIRSDTKRMLKFVVTSDFVSSVENIVENEKEMLVRLCTRVLEQLMTDGEIQAENWIKAHTKIMRGLDIHEIGEYFEENVLGTAPSPNLGAYHTYSELLSELIQLEETFPSLIDLVSIGKSWQNRDIWLVRITNENIGGKKPAALFVGEHHAREAITVEVCLRFIKYLLENYGNDPITKNAVDKETILVIPMLNPDGLEVINADPYKDWKRKNCRQDDDADGRVDEDPPNEGYEIGEGIDDDGDGLVDEDPPLDAHRSWGGVDLNRNYPFQWGGIGSDNSPYTDIYCGPESVGGFSEPETQAIQSLTENYTIRYALSFHSGTELVIYPWGYTGTPPPDENLFISVCKEIENETGYPYSQGYYEPYPTSGTFEDHLYGVNGTKTLCAEIYEGAEWGDMWKFFNPLENEISIYTAGCLPMLQILLKYSLLEPVSYWPLNEGSGTTAHDNSDYGNDGTIHGAQWVDGRLESALLFDGYDEYVSVPNSQSLQISDGITVDAWVYRHGQFRDEAVAMKRSENTGFGLWFSETDNKAYFGTGSTEFRGVRSASDIKTDNWYHIVGTYDNEVLKIYINGVLENSENISGQLAYNTTNLTIGKHNVTNSHYFDGIIDEVQIYDRSLNENEIWSHYSRMPPIIKMLNIDGVLAQSRVWTDNNISVTIKVTNDLSITLENVDVFLNFLDESGQSVRENGPVRITLAPSENQTFAMSITAPSSIGNYTLRARAEYASKCCDSTKPVEAVRGYWTTRATPEITSVGSALTVVENDVYVSGEVPTASVPYSLRVQYYMSRAWGGWPRTSP